MIDQSKLLGAFTALVILGAGVGAVAAAEEPDGRADRHMHVLKRNRAGGDRHLERFHADCDGLQNDGECTMRRRTMRERRMRHDEVSRGGSVEIHGDPEGFGGGDGPSLDTSSGR
jgi:hypothetical protein